MTDSSHIKARRVAIAGASGLVGQHILQTLLADETVSEVHALGRRGLAIKHPKLIVHRVDFKALPPLPPVDEVYLALGTTIGDAGSQAAFRAVDFDANLSVAHAALAAGARRIALVSAAGANAGSRVFYNRVKGELEDVLAELETDALLIARPSLLLGDRAALGQRPRAAEKVTAALFKLLGRAIPLGLRPVTAQRVAQALTSGLPTARGRSVLSSAQIQTGA
ncbi:Rossmann-fold NAD(P)-binding domain-containing protein [Uliginosibacterium aquaticum]|uniref:Nucleoside-diphosphate sugar epimerase n=1 Tax=Uliginosibacterium aquaticum TaxID=2731212 RepID=A0ABX2ILS1_9RHOO|nr:nucleoside-diphosphate sugar epimerase [Uliginosibacterium aquaticum]NSL54985.1 nucleoside-diphosphate sugar epimerase [Uliginosibacterium aquaticum]